MNGQLLRFRIGIFVLASLLLFAILAFIFGGFPTFLRTQDRFSVEFDEAPGVGPGTPVRRSGVRIGEVKSVKLEEEGVLVEIGIDQPNHIRHDEKPRLGTSILGGDITIDFVREAPTGKEPDKSFVQSGEKLKGEVPPSMRTVLGQATKIVEPTTKVLEQISTSLKEFHEMAPDMKETIREIRDLAKVTRETVRPPNNAAQTHLIIQTFGAQGIAPSGAPLSPLLQTVVAANVAEHEANVLATNEVRELVKATREVMPVLRQTGEDIGAAARKLGGLGERADVLLQANQEKLVKALENLNDVLSRVGLVFSDENQRNLAATLKNVRTSSDSLESITKNTDELLKDSRKTVSRVNDAMGKAEETMSNLQQATKPMAERSGNIMKNLDESTAKLNKTLTDVQELLRGLGSGDGTLRRLINDPALYNHLDEMAVTLARSMPRIDRILRDMEVFADKLARHPESIGVHGLTSPSSGLKESPTSSMPWPK